MTDPISDTADTLVEAVSPSRNDGITMAQAICEVCGSAFRRLGRRRFCCKRRASPALVPDACRQAAWRRRHSTPGTSGASALGEAQGRLSGRARRLPPSPPSGEARPARPLTVYECPSCGARYLGEQRCPDCGLFCRRVGPGGRCPHCDEPVAIADLIAGGEG